MTDINNNYCRSDQEGHCGQESPEKASKRKWGLSLALETRYEKDSGRRKGGYSSAGERKTKGAELRTCKSHLEKE